MKIQQVVFTLLVIMLINGCMMRTYDKADKGIGRAKDQAHVARTYTNKSPAEYRTKPRPNLRPVAVPTGPPWLRTNLNKPIVVDLMPFDMLVEEVLEGTGVVAKFSYDIETGLPVSLAHEKGTVQSALERLAARTNYAFIANNDSIEWQAYVTQVFSIPQLAGDYSFLIGKEDQQESSGQGGTGNDAQIDTSAFDVDRKQYSNLRGEKINQLKETGEMLKTMVGKEGLVDVHHGTSQILVKTTPDKMGPIKMYMDQLIGELTSQVRLELRIIQVTSNRGAEAGVNWSAIREITDGQLEFVGESALGRFTNAVPVAFSANKTYGGTDSVELLFSALEQQGDAAYVTEMHTQASSGTMAEMESGDIEAYLARVSTTQTTDVGSTQELIPGFIQSGDTLYTFNKIFGDKVAMAVSTRSSELEPLTRVGTEENFIQLPKMNSNRFNVQQVVRSGTTVIAASLRKEVNVKNKNSPVASGWAPTYGGAQSQIVDIYVLVTPRIIRGV